MLWLQKLAAAGGIFKALAPLGFEIDKTSLTTNQQLPENKPMPDYLKTMKPEQILNFDVRSMLAENNPLKQIQQK